MFSSSIVKLVVSCGTKCGSALVGNVLVLWAKELERAARRGRGRLSLSEQCAETLRGRDDQAAQLVRGRGLEQ